MKPVNLISPRQDINTAIAMPAQLASLDGRVFQLVRWTPSVSKEGVTIVCVLVPYILETGDRNG